MWALWLTLMNDATGVALSLSRLQAFFPFCSGFCWRRGRLAADYALRANPPYFDIPLV